MDAVHWIIIAVVVVIFLRKDDSDERGFWGRRSGLSISTDYKTGLQYVNTLLGGPTPRLNRDGTHMTDDTIHPA